jgi:hypothetical protein
MCRGTDIVAAGVERQLPDGAREPIETVLLGLETFPVITGCVGIGL